MLICTHTLNQICKLLWLQVPRAHNKQTQQNSTRSYIYTSSIYPLAAGGGAGGLGLSSTTSSRSSYTSCVSPLSGSGGGAFLEGGREGGSCCSGSSYVSSSGVGDWKNKGTLCYLIQFFIGGGGNVNKKSPTAVPQLGYSSLIKQSIKCNNLSCHN